MKKMKKLKDFNNLSKNKEYLMMRLIKRKARN
jgi:hypothetical protein